MIENLSDKKKKESENTLNKLYNTEYKLDLPYEIKNVEKLSKTIKKNKKGEYIIETTSNPKKFFSKSTDELFEIVKKLSELYEKNEEYEYFGYYTKDYVLLRDKFEPIKDFSGLPHSERGRLSNRPLEDIWRDFYKKEIKDLIAYLKLIDNPKDDISFLRIVNYPTRGIGNKTVENLQRKANLSNLSLYESIEEDDKKLILFKNLIEEIKDNYENISLKSLVERICEKTSLLETIKKDNDLESSIREENIKEFITYVDNYEKENNSSLREFLENLILFSDRENNNENEEKKVNLMTVHAVKGLEFKVVFVVGLEESLFPYQLSLENVQDIEEERRLYYVAVTRAKEKLYLLSAKRRYAFAKISYNPVSRFVYESNIDIIKEKSSWNVNFKVQKEQFYEEKNNEDYNVGDLVYHENFGKGSIVEIHDDILVIAFSYKYGIKKLLKNHKKLTKYEVE
mgnify:CR=1 FL=1